MSAVDTQERLPIADRAQVRRAVAGLVAADKTGAGLVLVLYTLAAAAGVALPLLLGEVVDGIAAGWSLTRINAVCGVIVACVALQLVFNRLGRRAAYRFGERAAARLRESVVDRVVSLPLGRVERAGTGDLGTRTATDVNAVADLLREHGPSMATALIEVAVLYVALFVVHPLVGLCSLATLPALVWMARRYLQRAREVFLDQRAAMSETAETLSASAAGARTVATFAMQEERRESGYGRAATLFAALMRIRSLQSAFFPQLLVLNRFQLLVVVLVAGLWFFEGWLSLGTAIAAITLTVRIANPTNAVMIHLTDFQQGAAALARIEGVRRIEREVRDARPAGVDVGLDAVVFGYGAGPDVLHHLTLHPRRGERLVIVGPSGAGKSTIARLLAGVDRPRSGAVTLGGVPVADIGIEELRKHVVLVTQEHYVFNTTLRENLDLAAPDADDEELLQALETVDARWATDLPDGLDTVLGEDHHRLGVAEAQQLALARVILADPDVVVLDEATAGIDPGSAGNVEAALAAALHGRTVIAIAHQLQAAEAADRVAVVEDGRIAEIGSHDELLAADGHYAALWRAWKGA